MADLARTIPTVHDAAYSSTLPLSHPSAGPIYIRERPVAADSDAPNLDTYLVSTNYVDVMRIPVLKGRGFLPSDTHTSARVAVISESAARTQFSGGDAIGQHIQIRWRDDTRPWAVIVGIIGDVHQYGLERSPDAAVYMPFAQVDAFQPTQLAVRTQASDGQAIDAVRRAVWAIDPAQPVANIQSMNALAWRTLARRRFQLSLWTAFAVSAALLALLGVYGVVSFGVRRSAKENGIRLALGARPSAVIIQVVAQAAVMAGLGAAAGLVIAYWTAGAVRGFLIAVEPRDPIVYGLVAIAAVACAMLAAALPARRAAGIDPLDAIRID